MKHVMIAAALLIASCTDPAPADPATAAWEYGPRCINDSGSCGVPAGPTVAGEGFVVDVPRNPDELNRSAAPHINYVTRRTGSLAGKSHIRIRFRVEGSPIRAAKPRGEVWDGKLTLYFARAGNDFTGGPTQNWYRWYASGSTVRLHPGEYEIAASFSDPWTAVSYGASHCTTDSNDPDCIGPARFREALENADRVGFVLGGGDGLGHGVHAEGLGARIVVVSFEVE